MDASCDALIVRAACLDAAVGGGWGVAAAADEEGADGALTLTLDDGVSSLQCVAAADAARDLLDMSAAACAALPADGRASALARCMRGERLWALTRDPAAGWRVDGASEQLRPESMEL